MKELLRKMNDFEIIELYGYFLDELKHRNLIRTNNLVGEWGERLAIKYYNENPILPNLRIVRIGEKSVDAINMNNERYNIKTTTTKTTGVFNGLNDRNSELPQEQKFEYVVIVILNKNLSVKGIYELEWQDFLSLKKWNRSKKTWYLSITKELKNTAKILYELNQI